MKVPNQKVLLPLLEEKNISLYIKREDLLHPQISGNKYRKLKYNLKQAKLEGANSLLTFGGAYSNHIVATAHAGKQFGFNTIGVIRGEEVANKWEQNPSLMEASRAGMKFKFISREDYREKELNSFQKKLSEEFGFFYMIPEGGTNALAIKGCEEILTEQDKKFDLICCSVGTGGTLSGIVNSSGLKQRILGFPALKGAFLKKDICKFARKNNWDMQLDYHFGGYGKATKALIEFMNDFKQETTIPLDPIYTGKMIYGILDLIARDYFEPSTRILAVHSGGLQGIKGMNLNLKMKNLPLINI